MVPPFRADRSNLPPAISFGARLRATSLYIALDRLYRAIGARLEPYLQHHILVSLVIIVLWACATLPHLTLRSFIYEEGTNAEIARDILAHRHLLEPSVYGARWGEKPSLLGWLIAAVAAPSGRVTEWSARLPAMVSVLVTALLIQSLARRYASPAASLFAALAFIFCPLLLQKLTIAEPDTIITVLSFAALLVWWDGTAARHISPWRWAACGTLLAILAMAKGPQPAGFFGLGIGAVILVQRRWRDIPGYVLCMLMPVIATIAWGFAVYHPGDEATWLAYARIGNQPPMAELLNKNLQSFPSLIVEILPITLLLPFMPWPWRRGALPDLQAPPIAAPLILYSGIGALALALWPGLNSRYGMPIVPTLAVLAALAWDRLEQSGWLPLRRTAATMLGIFIVFQIVFTVAIVPLFAVRFSETRAAGEAIARAVAADPAPIYCSDRDTNNLFYVPGGVRWIGPTDMATIATPAWLVTRSNRVAEFATANPALNLRVVVGPLDEPQIVAVRVDRK
jgi:4-amino-4-deoxy-L-arabinose transferase-like glycosyltransferase